MLTYQLTMFSSRKSISKSKTPNLFCYCFAVVVSCLQKNGDGDFNFILSRLQNISKTPYKTDLY